MKIRSKAVLLIVIPEFRYYEISGIPLLCTRDFMLMLYLIVLPA